MPRYLVGDKIVHAIDPKDARMKAGVKERPRLLGEEETLDVPELGVAVDDVPADEIEVTSLSDRTVRRYRNRRTGKERKVSRE